MGSFVVITHDANISSQPSVPRGDLLAQTSVSFHNQDLKSISLAKDHLSLFYCLVVKDSKLGDDRSHKNCH